MIRYTFIGYGQDAVGEIYIADGRRRPSDPCPLPLAPLVPLTAASAAASGMSHPPLLAGVSTTPLPLVATEPGPAQTNGGDAGTPPAAEREGSTASKRTAATVAIDLATDGSGGTGDGASEGLGSAVFGERATRTPVLEEAAWEGLGG